jgi:hypothetical protein
MESQRQIYQALIEGKTLVNSVGTKVVCGDHGNLVFTSINMPLFANPSAWSEYKAPQWYDNIRQSSGYPCWLWNDSSIKVMGLVVKYENNKFITSLGCKWDFAEPVKPEACYQDEK